MTRVLVANRGEIACRIMRSCRARGMETVAVHSEADAGSMHVASADISVEIGPGPAQESYLVAERILRAARDTSATAIHPGYGFLAENADFARAVSNAGLIWIGPRPDAIAAMGDKERARALARDAGLPLAAGSQRFGPGDFTGLAEAAEETGTPLLVKAANGGGGIGMRRVDRLEDVGAAAAATQQLAERAFGDGTVYLERYIPNARHIEVQVFGFGDGRAIHVYERDCSIQRRFQKIVEESSAPGVPDERLEAMFEAAVSLARRQKYSGAGTVEFIYDNDSGDFFFLEMNTRIQVEHPVSEMRTGLDLVGMQIDLAFGNRTAVSDQSEVAAKGHALECRVYAERPEKGFFPAPGLIEALEFPEADESLRIDTGVRAGDRIHHFYDPMIAKFVTYGVTRDLAVARMEKALAETTIEGPGTNIAFLGRVLGHDAFRKGELRTDFIARHQSDLGVKVRA